MPNERPGLTGFCVPMTHPFRPPLHPELGGWDGTFASLTLCIGIGINRSANNDCLLRPEGAFVWSDRTRTKLGDDKEKRMRYLLQILQLLYTLGSTKNKVESP